MSLLSELVSFHPYLHRCWRIWIIHAFCVIYVLAYSWRHKRVCVVSLLGRQIKTSAEFTAAEKKLLFYFFIIMRSWNWIVYESSFHNETVTDVCCAARRADRERLVQPFVFLSDWLNVTLTSSLHPKKKHSKREKNPLESLQSLGPGAFLSHHR